MKTKTENARTASSNRARGIPSTTSPNMSSSRRYASYANRRAFDAPRSVATAVASVSMRTSFNPRFRTVRGQFRMHTFIGNQLKSVAVQCILRVVYVEAGAA